MAQAQLRLTEVQTTLLAIAREEGIAGTLTCIAEQLNARGLRRETNKKTGKLREYDFGSVSKSLTSLGINRKSIVYWRRQCEAWALRETPELDPRYVLRQLREEWRYYHVRRVALGKHIAIDDLTEAFDFNVACVRPDKWISPWKRNKHPFVPILAAWNGPSKLVEVWLGDMGSDHFEPFERQ
jgi:hypothetical protein